MGRSGHGRVLLEEVDGISTERRRAFRDEAKGHGKKRRKVREIWRDTVSASLSGCDGGGECESECGTRDASHVKLRKGSHLDG